MSASVFSGALVYGHAVGIADETELYLRTGAIVVALIGAALRTIEEGLALDHEIERYNDYRGSTFHLLDRFSHSTDASERLHLMAALERASVEELAGFIRTHQHARFVFQ